MGYFYPEEWSQASRTSNILQVIVRVGCNAYLRQNKVQSHYQEVISEGITADWAFLQVDEPKNFANGNALLTLARRQ